MVEITESTLLIGLVFFAVFLVVVVLVFVILLMMRRRDQDRLMMEERSVSVKRKKAKKSFDTGQVSISESLRGSDELPSLNESVMEDYSNVKGFSSIKQRRSKWDWAYWQDWWNNKFNVSSIVLINLELVNGFHRTFLVKEKDGGFKYRGKKYIFDTSMKYYVIDNKVYAYDYHENFVLPVKRAIPVTDIVTTLENSEVTEVEYATNPATLERFTVSKIAEGILRGAELDQVFRFIKLVLIIDAIMTAIVLALLLQATGVLSGVSGTLGI